MNLKIQEEIFNSKQFDIQTAGYIEEDGSIIYVDEYHGESGDLNLKRGLPQFSSTHFEDDTCIRVFKKPTENQYKTLEGIIDIYLDTVGYCKIEIWDNKRYIFYKIYSLYEGACSDDTFQEIIGNWTGYDLVKIIKNQFYKKIDEATRSEILSKAKKGERYKNKEDNRWSKKTDSTIANTVKDYNQIDMDTFWKKDTLSFGVKITGKTSSYVVYISFSNIFNEIQHQVKLNKNKLSPDIIYKALLTCINSEDVKFNCSCPDYKYRLKYFASKNGYNYGEQETRASKITNPEDTKGPACKHIIAALNNLEWLKKIASVINNYANYCKDKMEYNYARYIFPKLYGITYDKAVQLTIDDFDKKGNMKDNLHSDEATINLANALGKVRGRFKKKNN